MSMTMMTVKRMNLFNILPILVVAVIMQFGWKPLVRATANRLFNSFPQNATNTTTSTTKLSQQMIQMSSSSSVMPKLDFKLTPQQIHDTTKALIGEYKQELDKIGLTPKDKCNFENIIVQLALLEGRFTTNLASLTFPQYVHPDQQVRDACIAAQQVIDQFAIEKGMREDIFKVVKAVGDKELSSLKGEEKRIVEKMLLDFKLNGLYLDEEKRKQLKQYRQELAEAELAFSKAINADKTTIEFSKEELDGCSDAFLSSLEFNESSKKYIVTMKYPDLLGVMRNAKREETRRQMSTVNDSRVPQNMEQLAKAVELRAKAAKLLGFKDHTELQLSDRMAKTPQAVNSFVKDLIEKLRPKAEAELKVLREMKKAETGSDTFNTWDFPYYSNQLTQRQYSVDHELLREYFPVDHVSREMLKIYEEVLGLSFEEVTNDPSSPLWQSEVRLYKVLDASTKDLVGHVYFDLHPRDGKYTHAACFGLQPGYQMSKDNNSDRQYPASAMVCNFSKATSALPSLLKHDEVVTFFHELGHAMHGMCAKTRFSRFHGTNTETDYVEAPSQMLENWCWEKAILKRLSKHYKTGHSLPDDLISKLISSRLVNAGLLNLRQLFFATYDMHIHSHPSHLSASDLNQWYADLRKNITMLAQPPQVTPAATWGHLMGGYDAGYYGYMWSLVFSSDMYQSQFASHIDGGAVGEPGRRYREKVLGPGGSRDGMDMLVDFLGRAPSSEAFLKQLGL